MLSKYLNTECTLLYFRRFSSDNRVKICQNLEDILPICKLSIREKVFSKQEQRLNRREYAAAIHARLVDRSADSGHDRLCSSLCPSVWGGERRRHDRGEGNQRCNVNSANGGARFSF